MSKGRVVPKARKSGEGGAKGSKASKRLVVEWKRQRTQTTAARGSPAASQASLSLSLRISEYVLKTPENRGEYVTV